MRGSDALRGKGPPAGPLARGVRSRRSASRGRRPAPAAVSGATSHAERGEIELAAPASAAAICAPRGPPRRTRDDAGEERVARQRPGPWAPARGRVAARRTEMRSRLAARRRPRTRVPVEPSLHGRSGGVST